jgi:hypothetical protein
MHRCRYPSEEVLNSEKEKEAYEGLKVMDQFVSRAKLSIKLEQEIERNQNK